MTDRVAITLLESGLWDMSHTPCLLFWGGLFPSGHLDGRLGVVLTGYVCSELGDTFAAALRPLMVMKVTLMWVWMMRRFQGKTSGRIPERPITPTIINTMAKFGQELIDPAVRPLGRLRSHDKAKGTVSYDASSLPLSRIVSVEISSLPLLRIDSFDISCLPL
jgi:hypothetical protein